MCTVSNPWRRLPSYSGFSSVYFWVKDKNKNIQLEIRVSDKGFASTSYTLHNPISHGVHTKFTDIYYRESHRLADFFFWINAIGKRNDDQLRDSFPYWFWILSWLLLYLQCRFLPKWVIDFTIIFPLPNILRFPFSLCTGANKSICTFSFRFDSIMCCLHYPDSWKSWSEVSSLFSFFPNSADTQDKPFRNGSRLTMR